MKLILLFTIFVFFFASSIYSADTCQDYGTFCESWKKNGFCEMCFYKCDVRVKYCPKTCGFCDPTKCVDCPPRATEH
ncbi:hypothetical protein GCK72_005754 [Caenorhabditis remanei]|uniref:ShKT domain-containing protein n=1 Tax=Caenorhabditis remanei TaxID=31234 RepID=E3MMX6_CAERE|nr:hypothetical protein GCK72_005754 [Caenorhabditis remanei]EFP05180.1 hypothetical protein CRE_04105 [Caenorhabditis remanei]KAF1765801.1 hypothetical protein GCK72_005754 [Caenorhabditis remanei]